MGWLLSVRRASYPTIPCVFCKVFHITSHLHLPTPQIRCMTLPRGRLHATAHTAPATGSREMETLLLNQQINHKIPGYLPDHIPVAHKTGEDDGITNDVGIVYAAKPFVVCFAANHTDVPEAERAIREISLALALPDR